MLSLEEKNNKKSQVKKRKRWVGIGGTQHTHREIKNKNEDKYVEVASSKLLPRRHEDVVCTRFMLIQDNNKGHF